MYPIDAIKVHTLDTFASGLRRSRDYNAWGLMQMLTDEDANHQFQRDTFNHRRLAQHIPDCFERRCPESMARHVQRHRGRRSVWTPFSPLVL